MLLVVPHERCRTKWWADRASGQGTDSQIIVLADPGFWVSSLYGVAFQMRIHTDVSNTPGTFVIDKQGILRWGHVGQGEQNWRDRPNVEQVLEKVREISK